MNAIVFDVKVNKSHGDEHLNIKDETPVVLRIYKKLFGSVPKKNYKVVYYLNKNGKYYVNPPKSGSTWARWPYLTIDPDHESFENDLAYVCKMPSRWFGKRVSRKVIS